jgi:AcrR family transcriptional regulator
MNLKIDELDTPAAEPGQAYAPASGPVNGRQRLIEAAIRLANQNGGINAVGMRELAREAGLNPNTFYRHFESIDDLGVAVLETVLPSLSEGLRVRRSQITSFGESSRETIAYFFEFVDAHPKSITFATRELNGPSTRLRETLAAAIAGITEDLVSAILRNRWAPFASEAVIRDISDTVIKQLFSLALDYESQQQDRAEVIVRAERFVLMMFAGAYFVETLKLDLNSAPALLGVAPGAGKKT